MFVQLTSTNDEFLQLARKSNNFIQISEYIDRNILEGYLTQKHIRTCLGENEE